jgi:hypothetical protein
MVGRVRKSERSIVVIHVVARTTTGLLEHGKRQFVRFRYHQDLSGMLQWPSTVGTMSAISKVLLMLLA